MDILRDNPALIDPEWMPEGLSPEVDELRSEHIALIQSWQSVGRKARELRKRFEAEDKAKIDAIRNDDDIPDSTSSEERKELLKDADMRVQVKREAVATFVEKAIKRIQELEGSLLNSLASKKARAMERRSEALEVLDESDELVRRLSPVEGWLSKTVRNTPGRHIAIGNLGVPPAEIRPNLAHILGHPDPDTLDKEEALA